jgi:hypothetical protein
VDEVALYKGLADIGETDTIYDELSGLSGHQWSPVVPTRTVGVKGAQLLDGLRGLFMRPQSPATPSLGATEYFTLMAKAKSAWEVSKRDTLTADELGQLKLNIDYIKRKLLEVPADYKYRAEMVMQVQEAEVNYSKKLNAADDKARADVARKQDAAATISLRIAQEAAAKGDQERAAQAAANAKSAADAAAQADWKTQKVNSDARKAAADAAVVDAKTKADADAAAKAAADEAAKTVTETPAASENSLLALMSAEAIPGVPNWMPLAGGVAAIIAGVVLMRR